MERLLTGDLSGKSRSELLEERKQLAGLEEMLQNNLSLQYNNEITKQDNYMGNPSLIRKSRKQDLKRFWFEWFVEEVGKQYSNIPTGDQATTKLVGKILLRFDRNDLFN